MEMHAWRRRQRRPIALVLLILLALVTLNAWLAVNRPPDVHAQPARLTAKQRLGQRLFREEGFTAPNGDFSTSCRTCHLFDEDPQGQRAYADFFNRSWQPYRTQDPKRSMSRNAPALYDAALMPRLHWDGEFASLEELVVGTFTGRPLGWLPEEQAQASAQVRAVLLRTTSAPSYAPQFKEAFNVELAKLPEAAVLKLVASAVADYLRTFKSEQNAPYDRFLRANQLAGLATQPGELLATLDARAATLKLLPEFNAEALRGLAIFLRTSGTNSVGTNAVGNCVACHAPPLFTDHDFHNLGFSQLEYDQVHGAGAFAALEIPGLTAKRPLPRFREAPTRAQLGEADLGYWNFVDLPRAPQRRPGETDEQLLQRMIGAVKTPTLRHLAYSGPYMHTGAYTDLAESLREIMRLSELARAGKVRSADAELARIQLSEADIAPLVAFLRTLNEDLRVVY